MINQSVIEANLANLDAQIINNLVLASEAQVCGANDTVECHLKKVYELLAQKELIESLCPGHVPVVNENIELLCDPNKKGIGEWAIEYSLRNCGVFQVQYSQQPPPYGEFSYCEFQTNNFTKVVGDVSGISC